MQRSEREKTWFDGTMTLEKAEMIRRLRAEGAQILHLAMAFGIRFSAAGRIARGETYVGKQCRECWRKFMPVEGARSNRCQGCQKSHCNHCGKPKPESRKSPRCRECDRENFHGTVARNHHCAECGEELPETRKSRYCVECTAENACFQTRFRNNEGKKCTKCGEPVPLTPHWKRNLCRACAEKHDALRRALSRRYCGICGKIRKDDSKGALCPECQRDDDRIRRRGTTVTPQEHIALRERKR